MTGPMPLVSLTVVSPPPAPWRVIVAPLMQLGVIGVGIWADSPAMQWAGFGVLALTLLVYVILSARRSAPISIAQARARLDELEREGAAHE